jgi:hypothetical protein
MIEKAIESPIEKTIENWHKHLRGKLDGGLDTLLHEDVVFYSPIVYTPQRGIEVTKMYLMAAGANLGGGAAAESGSKAKASQGKGFGYRKEVLSGNTAILEFETTLGGKYVNGVDIIVCDDDGMIVEFRVMIRPLQAINLLHQQMAATLEKMQAG